MDRGTTAFEEARIDENERYGGRKMESVEDVEDGGGRKVWASGKPSLIYEDFQESAHGRTLTSWLAGCKLKITCIPGG